MPREPYHRHPLGSIVVIGLAMLVALMLALFLVDAIAYAYRRIGISEGALFALVLASLFGGAVDIPIARLRGKAAPAAAEIVAFGMRYRVPIVRRPAPTILAVNLGGALIPTGVSLLLVIHDELWWQAAIAILAVATLVHAVARPVAGLGVAVPGLLPPLAAAAAAVLLDPHAAAAVAYISGTLGTLIGADLMNLRRLSSLGAGVASIGGAGTFDGVFLSGVIAVLLIAFS